MIMIIIIAGTKVTVTGTVPYRLLWSLLYYVHLQY